MSKVRLYGNSFLDLSEITPLLLGMKGWNSLMPYYLAKIKCSQCSFTVEGD